MRTVLRVMIVFLLLPCGVGFGQSTENTANGTLDSDVTIVGSDETVLPIPPPWHPQEIAIPEPDMTPPDPLLLPAIPPPPVAWSAPWEDFPVVDDSGEPLP
jgi:hypothetical protein